MKATVIPWNEMRKRPVRQSMSHRAFIIAVCLICATGFAQLAPNRYALILADPPVAIRFPSGAAMHSSEAVNYHQRIQARQRVLRNELASRNIHVTTSVTDLLNAVFVVASTDQVADLKSLPGVIGVVQQRLYTAKLNRATQLVNAPAAWNTLGGIENSGRGMKIAILDSGIDQTHPMFQDSSLPMPAGYPLCSEGDCAFTNNKVIVARSYVRLIAAGSSPNTAVDSRPDDYSARDRDGHGTAVASCAAGNTATGSVTINGMAPKAYLGSYKITGSPTVNDGAPDDVIVQAVEDAMHDGMDVVSFSLGSPAFAGPLDIGAACGNDPGVACDLIAQTFENATKAGLVIVAAGGNEGQDGNNAPTFNSIDTPGDAPSVIAVGATTNSHYFLPSVDVAGGPANLQVLAGQPTDAFGPIGAITAPVVDITQLGNDGLACSALPAGSLKGAFALIERGTCSFSTKLTNAENAGAIGVIFYMADSSATVSPTGLSSFSEATVVLSNADGVALKNFIDANPGHAATIDPAGVEQSSPKFNQAAFFSSFGPSTGDSGIKPDLLAPGAVPPDGIYGGIYMAAERYDPLGELYSSNGYAAADGTSFSTPIVAGAAALVKQNHPGFTAAQIKSALVNTASQAVTTDDSGNPVNIMATGAGLLDTGAAVNSTVTANPSSLSFGVLKSGSVDGSKPIQITNSGSSAVNLNIALVQTSTASGTNLSLDKQSVSIAPNSSSSVTVSLSGSVPKAGAYYGAITLQGSGTSLRVPYLFLAGSGVAANIIPLIGNNFDGTVGQGIPDGVIAFKLVDANGVPVAGAPVTWTSRGGGTLQNASTVTDAYGVATAAPILGSQKGTYTFIAVAGGLRLTFSGTARLQPAISQNGVVNAASFEAGKAVAPGSYISIFGSGLSDFTDFAQLELSGALPLAIDSALVSFDVPSANISLPAHLIYVSPGQVNVQVPWELQGQSSAQAKVTIGFSYGNVVSVPLSDYSPAFFEVSSGAVAALDANSHVIGSSNPAKRGQAIQLFANGLGPVTNQPASGDPAPSSPLAQTKSPAAVTIGGQPASVSFSGLAPGFAGLYQVNVTVPANIAAGNQSITVAIGGQTSKTSGIVVQ
ncbi:MAG: S8 family serine peptidase [Bryobacteraceae bacterium]